MKKIILMLLLAFLAVFCANPAISANLNEMSDEEAMALLAAEPPLTQTDIDTFVKHAPELQKAAEVDNETAYLEVIKEIGWTEIRAAYIHIKIGMAWAASEDPESAAMMQALFPPEMLPLPEERALVDKNMDKIKPFFNEETE